MISNRWGFWLCKCYFLIKITLSPFWAQSMCAGCLLRLLFKGAAQLGVRGSDASWEDTATRFVCLQPPEKQHPATPHQRFVKEAWFAAQIIAQILAKLLTIAWNFWLNFVEILVVKFACLSFNRHWIMEKQTFSSLQGHGHWKAGGELRECVVDCWEFSAVKISTEKYSSPKNKLLVEKNQIWKENFGLQWENGCVGSAMPSQINLTSCALCLQDFIRGSLWGTKYFRFCTILALLLPSLWNLGE